MIVDPITHEIQMGSPICVYISSRFICCFFRLCSTYECKRYKRDSSQKAQIKHVKAPQPLPLIQRDIAIPSVLAKVKYDKFYQYLPLCRQVKKWKCFGLNTVGNANKEKK